MLNKIILAGIESQKRFLESVYEAWNAFPSVDSLELYAKQLDKSVCQLSEMEKRQACLNTIFRGKRGRCMMFHNPVDALNAIDGTKGTLCPVCAQWIPANSFHSCGTTYDGRVTDTIVVQKFDTIIRQQEKIIRLLENIDYRLSRKF